MRPRREVAQMLVSGELCRTIALGAGAQWRTYGKNTNADCSGLSAFDRRDIDGALAVTRQNVDYVPLFARRSRCARFINRRKRSSRRERTLGQDPEPWPLARKHWRVNRPPPNWVKCLYAMSTIIRVNIIGEIR